MATQIETNTKQNFDFWCTGDRHLVQNLFLPLAHHSHEIIFFYKQYSKYYERML